MKIVIKKIDLEYVVSLTLKALSSKIDGRLGIITMRAFNDKLTISTGDDGIVISSIAKVEVLENGVVNVPGKLLYESIRKTADCELEIEDVGERLIINCPNGHICLPCVDVGWDGYKQASQGAKVVIAKSALKETIKKTISFCSTDIARPLLRGVNFVSDGPMLTAVALDGYRVAKVQAELLNAEAAFNVVVPANALGCIDSLLDAEGSVELLISCNENLLQIRTEEIEIVSTLLQGNFVDVNHIIPKEFIATMKVRKDDFNQALDRAMLFSNSYNLADLTISDSNVVIKSQSDTGESESTVDCKKEGQDLNIAFNAKYIIGALKLLTADDVLISFSKKEGPAVIKEEDSLFLFLPLRRS